MFNAEAGGALVYRDMNSLHAFHIKMVDPSISYGVEETGAKENKIWKATGFYFCLGHVYFTEFREARARKS